MKTFNHQSVTRECLCDVYSGETRIIEKARGTVTMRLEGPLRAWNSRLETALTFEPAALFANNPVRLEFTSFSEDVGGDAYVMSIEPVFHGKFDFTVTIEFKGSGKLKNWKVLLRKQTDKAE